MKMSLFSQSINGEVRKWFKSLPATTINDLATFYQSFLNKWETKNNTLQVLNEYKNLKRGPNEIVEEYYDRFNRVYSAIPAAIKPPLGLALIHFPEGFDFDMAYQLRERDPTTLEEMQSNVVKVEANLLAKKSKLKTERRITIKEEPSSSSSYLKIDNLVKIMERIMERMTRADRTPPRDNQINSQNINHNLRRNTPLMKQREQRSPNDQQLRPSFQENYVEEEVEIEEIFRGTPNQFVWGDRK